MLATIVQIVEQKWTKRNEQMTHYIKLSDKLADAVLNGEKTFEVRYNDRGYNTGDKIVFTVVDDVGVSTPHLLNTKVYEITYVLSGWGIKENFVVFSIKPVEIEY